MRSVNCDTVKTKGGQAVSVHGVYYDELRADLKI